MATRHHPGALVSVIAFSLTGACFVEIHELNDGPGGASGSAGAGGVAAGGASTGGTGVADGGAGSAGDAGAAGGGGSTVDAGDASDAGNGVPPACTTAFFVANDGDDADPGTLDEPWKTLDRLATVSLDPGDCILFRRGDVWVSPLDVVWSGAQGAPIIIGAYGFGNAPVVREVQIVERDFVTLQDVRVSGADVMGVTLQDCEVEFAADTNVMVKNGVDVLLSKVLSHDANNGLTVLSEAGALSQDVVVEDSKFHNHADAGITIMTVSGDHVLRPIVRRTVLHDNKQGINDLASDEAMYHHNVLYGHEAAVINITKAQADPLANAARNVRLFNNVLYNPAPLAWHTMLFIGANNAGIVAKNNVFVSDASDQLVVVAEGGGATLDHNVYHGGGALNWHGAASNTLADWQSASGQDANSWMEDPSFEDPPLDMHVQSGSPCIDHGVDVGLTHDIDGDPLPQGGGFDIGVQDQ